MENLKKLLLRHEGLKLKPYRDTVGKLTIGVGRNLEDKGLSPQEAFMLLEADINVATIAVKSVFKGFEDLSEARQAVLISMAFNMGLGGLCEFRNMFAALERSDFDTASKEMLYSKWATQVGVRAIELADMMKTDTFPKLA